MPGKIKTIVPTVESKNMTQSEFIDDYFSGSPTPADKEVFEKRLQTEPAFADEVALYLSVIAVKREDADKESKLRFKELYISKEKETATPVVKFRWLKPLMSAAAVLIVVLLAWTFFLKSPSASQLADKYIETNLKEFPLKMGPDNEIQEAKNLINNGKLAEASKKLEDILIKNPGNADIIELAGIVSLRMDNYDKALGYFDWLAKEQGYFTNPGEFYQALTLLKRNQPGDIQKAKVLLQDVVNKNLTGNETAKEWLKDL